METRDKGSGVKKLTIIGKGTVGCVAVSHFLKWSDMEIDWVYDPSIPTTPVGEGTTLVMPRTLSANLAFNYVDLEVINSTPKLGIWKRNWGKGGEFKHAFPAGSIGIHFNAVDFQNYVFDKLSSNPRVAIYEKNIIVHDSIDSDYILDCSGSPKEMNDLFDEKTSIPVNSAMVFQCPWASPKFLYSITFAKKYGWVFGIPLTNRCAIGYVYNNKFCTETDIEKDVQSVLDEFGLEPKLIRKLNFFNYSRKQNFDGRVCYNGNASFFLEPLEATSTSTADYINRLFFDCVVNKSINMYEFNSRYKRELRHIEGMICLHYFCGSSFKTDFWEYAKDIATKKLKDLIASDFEFSECLDLAISQKGKAEYSNIGTWPQSSYYMNIEGLGVQKEILKLLNK